jgi:hypothetical protein
MMDIPSVLIAADFGCAVCAFDVALFRALGKALVVGWVTWQEHALRRPIDGRLAQVYA